MSDKSGFEFTGSGRVDRVDTFTTKSGKDIVTVVVQVEGTYPKLVPIKFFGRTADEASSLSKGDVIEAHGHLGGRDWNGKVYGDIEGERFEIVHTAAKKQNVQGAPPPDDQDLPF